MLSEDKVSLWFNPKEFHSFTEWIVYFFEQEVLEAYDSKISNSLSNNIYAFVEQKIEREVIVKQIKLTIAKKEKGKKNNKVKGQLNEADKLFNLKCEHQENEKQFLLSQCIQKIQNNDRDIEEVILEIQWFSLDKQSKISNVFQSIAEWISIEHQKYLFQQKIRQIEDAEQKKKNKKKPKKQKKEELTQIDLEEQKLQIKYKVQEQNHSKIVLSTEKLQQQSKKQEQLEQQILKNQTDLLLQNPSMSKQQSHCYEQKNQLIENRINENLKLYINLIYERSKSIGKYRDFVYQVIKQSLSEMQIKGKWDLKSFGSSVIDFCLKESDLDLVLIVDSSQSCSLSDVQNCLKPKKWCGRNKIISMAKVPILNLQVALGNLGKLKSKQQKKHSNDFISVDISIAQSKQQHQGIANTGHLKEMFQNFPHLKQICLLFKQMLRIYNLNKTFTGGINSYVLVIMVYNILTKKKLQINDNYLEQIKVVSNYLIHQFEPFVSVISPFQDKFNEQKGSILTIINPKTLVKLNTNGKLINEIINVFHQLLEILEKIEAEMNLLNKNQKKKMKKVFYQHINILFSVDDME